MDRHAGTELSTFGSTAACVLQSQHSRREYDVCRNGFCARYRKEKERTNSGQTKRDCECREELRSRKI